MSMRFPLLVVCLSVTTTAGRLAIAQEKTPNVALEYGFRYDPMEFVENSDALQGALVRRYVFRTPKPGDEAILQKRIEEILAEQREDGTLGEPGHDRAAKLMELADCGADRDDPRVKRAIEASLRGDPEKDDEVWVRDIRALCLFGVADDANVKRSLQAILGREEEWNGPYKICPWGQAFYLRGLWPAREIVDTRECCRRTLRWMLDGLNEAGCVSYKDPWGLVWCAGIIDLPEAKQLIERLVPTILRGQEPDGSWGNEPYDQWSKNSLKVFQALVNHGLLDRLRELPPLPPDWKVVREIPAPEGDLWTMTWDGESLWVMDREACEAIAVSPQDGAVRKRVKIPFEKPRGIGWWDDGLGVAQNGPKRVVKLDPDTGEVVREVPVDKPDWCEVSGVAQVNGELWVNDDFNGVIRRVDPGSGAEPTLHGSAGSLPCSLTPVPGGVWEIDAFSPYLVQSDHDAKLLDLGEKPFGGRCDGLAWDGEDLWALDSEGRRICVIEKAE